MSAADTSSRGSGLRCAAHVANLRGDLIAWLGDAWAPLRPFEEGGFEEWRAGWTALATATTGDTQDLLRVLRSVEDAGEAILREHDALFVTRASFYAAPFESVYIGASKDQDGWSLNRLRGFPFKQVKVEYARAGFLPPKELLPDHLTTELRYLAALCVAEADAFTRNELGRARQLRERERDFLSQHLLCWLPTLCERLEDSDERCFFPKACRVMLTYLEQERDYVSEPT
ncbi:MAG: molecular chaperone TorD family protein [Deltaproteobacteria bacterium]|nr:molecular chaperone TorD family protein [Deltaproteobacteria bacterium]